MDQFPQMLYKAGGPEQIHGGAFSTLTVNDEAEHAAALADGWCENTPDALDADQAAKERAARDAAAKLAAASDIKPPTREELEQKANELGIAFKPQTSDKKLAEAIAAKLAE